MIDSTCIVMTSCVIHTVIHQREKRHLKPNHSNNNVTYLVPDLHGCMSNYHYMYYDYIEADTYCILEENATYKITMHHPQYENK